MFSFPQSSKRGWIKRAKFLKDDYIQCIQRFLKESANDPEILNVTNMKIGRPTAITTFGNDLIYVLDHDDKSVIEVRLKNNECCLLGEGRKVCQLASTSLPRSLTVTPDGNLFIADGSQEGGIYIVSIESGACDLLIKNNTPDCTKVHGIVYSPLKKVLFTDIVARQVKEYDPVEKEISVVVGLGEKKSVDGHQGAACFEHPMALAMQHKSIFMIDNRNVRIVTNVESLKKFLRILRLIFAAFNVHKDILRHSCANSVEEALSFINEAIQILEEMLCNAKKSFNHNLVCQGPQGTPAEKTVGSVKQLSKLLEQLQHLAKTYNPHLLESLKLKSLLTLNNEYFNGIIRDFVPTPTQFDVAVNFVDASEDALYTLVYAGFPYYTREGRTYDMPSSDGLTCSAVVEPVKKEKPLKYDKMVVQDLLEYRRDFGQGLRQQKIRGATTKDRPGTLPLYLYTAPDENQDIVDVEQILSGVPQEPEATEEEEVNTEIISFKHVYAIKRSPEEMFFGFLLGTRPIRAASKTTTGIVFTQSEEQDFVFIRGAKITASMDEIIGDSSLASSIEEKDGKILISEADYLNILKKARGDSTDDCGVTDNELSDSDREENSDSNDDDQSNQVDLIRAFERSATRTRARSMPRRYHDYIA